MKKILIVIGTRPEAVKMCPLVLELNRRQSFETIVCVTAQHRQMLDRVLEIFGVVPDYDLDIMREQQTLFDISTRVLEGLRDVIIKSKPDIVLVHGDTSTAFAAALASFYMGIPVGHVESGLRTYDISSPYPEEFNRQGIDIISQYNFVPTLRAAENLKNEGKKENTIFITGNTIVDTLRYTIRDNYTHPELDWVGSNRLIFITAHRRENIGEPMRCMFRAIRRVLEEHLDCKALYPIHLNPIVRKIAFEELGSCSKIKMIEPLDFIDCHNFESRSFLCLTDSGGIQEECPSFGVPVLVMRKNSERTEGIDAGTARITGIDEKNIYNLLTLLLENEMEYKKMILPNNPYGDGHACERIANILEGKTYDPFEQAFKQ